MAMFRRKGACERGFMVKESLQAENAKNITELFLRLSSGMLRAKDRESFLESILVDVGSTLHVHRVYLFSYDGRSWENTYSWVDSRLPPFKDLIDASTSLQDAMYADGMYTALSAGQPYVIWSVKDFKDPDARILFEQESIDSLIIIPLFSEGKLNSFFGVDQCFGVEEYGVLENWARDTLNIMLTMGHLLNNAMHYFSSLKILDKKNDETQELFNMLPFPMYVTDSQSYDLLACNTTLEQYLGTQDLLGHKCYKKIMDSDEPCSFCSTKYLSLNGDPYIWDLHGYKGVADFKVIDSCIPWGDLEAARLTIAIDITDSLRMERERVLDKESTQAKSRFLANMSHELRTPLNGIIGMTDLAIKHNEDARVGDYLYKAKESSKKLLEIINDILDFSKLEAGKLELEQYPFTVREVCQEAQDLLQEEAQRKGLSLESFVDAHVSDILVGDALRFSQIIYHLIKNAIKFTEQGFIRISISPSPSEQGDSYDASTQVLLLKVEDSGIGMSQETLERLFKEFMQADSSNTRRYGGTGLGLTIVEGVLDLMGGSISVKSKEGEGTAFTCRIPFLMADAATQTAMLEMQDENIEGTNILLAEDNDINAIITQEVLSKMGCIVDWVQDGYKVLQKLEHKTYDLILMDVHMPNMDGIQATKRVRADARFDTLPIVALTAHILKEEIDQCLEAGMQSHALKPISSKALRQAIATFTKKPFLYQR